MNFHHRRAAGRHRELPAGVEHVRRQTANTAPNGETQTTGEKDADYAGFGGNQFRFEIVIEKINEHYYPEATGAGRCEGDLLKRSVIRSRRDPLDELPRLRPLLLEGGSTYAFDVDKLEEYRLATSINEITSREYQRHVSHDLQAAWHPDGVLSTVRAWPESRHRHNGAPARGRSSTACQSEHVSRQRRCRTRRASVYRNAIPGAAARATASVAKLAQHSGFSVSPPKPSRTCQVPAGVARMMIKVSVGSLASCAMRFGVITNNGHATVKYSDKAVRQDLAGRTGGGQRFVVVSCEADRPAGQLPGQASAADGRTE